jgi:hypothetical protein
MGKKPAALGLLAIGCGLGAVEGNPPPGPEAPQPPPVPPPRELLGWSHQAHPGAFLTTAYASGDNENAPDPAIRGASSSVAYRVQLDAALAWRGDRTAVDQRLHAAYGRVRQEGVDWAENLDELRYDGVFRRDVIRPNFIYRAWGAESVFTSDPPGDGAFDPVRIHSSWGFGQLYRNLQPESDALEWRLGVRIQKAWGDSLTTTQGDLLIGPEAMLRYEQQLSQENRWFAMYEGWGDFDDSGHLTQVITGGLSAHLATHVTAEFALRIYFEGRPREADVAEPGYNRWYARQDTMIGLSATF